MTPDDVLDFWIGAPAADHDSFMNKVKRWFRVDKTLDAEIRTRFGDAVQKARDGALDDWAKTPRGRLALIILLDQFTRNVFRDTPRAFAGDARALAAAQAMVASGADRALSPQLRAFVYLPFEHAEDAAPQDEAVRLFARLVDEASELHALLDYAQRHRAVVQRFGRFPHRNEILGRVSSAEETAFLREPGSRF